MTIDGCGGHNAGSCTGKTLGKRYWSGYNSALPDLSQAALMQGLHLTADLYRCRCDAALLTQPAALAERCRTLTVGTGLTLVGEKWHGFASQGDRPGGVTGMLLLAESHLAVHTWPEQGSVTLDVYVCNFTADNSAKAERLLQSLKQVFQPEQAQNHRLRRGEIGAHEPDAATVDTGGFAGPVWEALNAESVYGFRFARRLLAQRTAYQQLEILESPQLGRTLRLDGRFMTAETEEFFYHEALVHPAAIAHPHPRRAAIIGGGDGGAAEELLKHPSIEHISLVELDRQVVDVAKDWLGAIHQGSLNDARVSIEYGDGLQFLRRAQPGYDLILLDLTDPQTPAAPLYTPECFALCRPALAPGGALVLHLGAPFYQPDQVRRLAAALAAQFPSFSAYGLHIPLYGAYWALAVASDSLAPPALNTAQVAQRLAERGIADLQYYNAEIHGALFALPNYYRALLPRG